MSSLFTSRPNSNQLIALEFKGTMAPTPFFPYIPINTNYTSPTPSLLAPISTSTPSSHPCSRFNNTTIAHASAPTPTILISSEAGTSLATPDIVGIIAAVLFLFGGLAWFAYHAFVTLPRRKKALLRERRKRGRNEGRGRSRVV
jgi:hypothetical protein